MTADISDEMVADMDETGDFMHTTPPPFPSIEGASNLTFGRQSRPVKPFKGLSTARCANGIQIVGREQGEINANRNQAIRVGSIG